MKAKEIHVNVTVFVQSFCIRYPVETLLECQFIMGILEIVDIYMSRWSHFITFHMIRISLHALIPE